MQQAGKFEAAGSARPIDHVGQGHPGLVRLDRVRNVLVQTGLAPEPETYEILYLYVSNADRALSREIERRLESAQLSLSAIRALRTTYLGDIAAGELLELAQSAHDSATGLIGDLGHARVQLASYDAVIEAGEDALSDACTAADLARLVKRLRLANSEMLAANRKLEADIRAVTGETGRLLDRLHAAEHAASTDPLTGLPNRRGLLAALRQAQATVQAEGRSLSVSLVDIDNFAEFNRQWGVDIGDEVLRCVGAHLRTSAQKYGSETAVVGRYGSDEFAIVLPDLDLQQSVSAVEQMRAGLARQMLRRADDGANLGRVTFSAGVARHQPDDTPEALVDRADAALFRAKRIGRDRVLPEKSLAAPGGLLNGLRQLA